MFFEVLILCIDVKTLLLPEVTFHNFLTRKGSIVTKFKENFMYYHSQRCICLIIKGLSRKFVNSHTFPKNFLVIF